MVHSMPLKTVSGQSYKATIRTFRSSLVQTHIPFIICIPHPFCLIFSSVSILPSNVDKSSFWLSSTTTQSFWGGFNNPDTVGLTLVENDSPVPFVAVSLALRLSIYSSQLEQGQSFGWNEMNCNSTKVARLS